VLLLPTQKLLQWAGVGLLGIEQTISRLLWFKINHLTIMTMLPRPSESKDWQIPPVAVASGSPTAFVVHIY